MKKYIFALLIFFPVASFASFEDIQIGARQAGMAEAYSALADDSYAPFYNPAGLINISQIEISSMYSRLFYGLDDNSNWVNQSFALAYPINSNNSLGVGWYGKNFSDLYRENTFVAGYGSRILKILSFGINLKARQKKYGSNEWIEVIPAFAAKKEITKFSSDLGFLLNVGESFWGVSLQDFTQPNIGLFDKTALPMTTRLGFFRQFWPELKIAADFIYRKKDYEINMGFENEFKKLLEGFSLRSGFGIGNDQYKTISMGLGYLFNKSQQFRIDYGFNYPLSGIEGTAGSHLFSLDIKFGENKHLSKKQREQIRQKEEKEKTYRIQTENEYRRALNFYKDNRLIQAYESFESILNGKTQNVPKILNLCQKYRILILKQIEEIVGQGEKSPNYYYARGFISYTKKDYKNALNNWDKITVLNPHFPEASLYIIKIKTILQEIEKIKIAEKRSKAESLFRTGLSLFNRGHYSEAVLYFQSSNSLYPKEETNIYIQRSRLRLEENINKPNLKTDHKEEFFSQGIIEYRLGNFRKAADCFTQALKLEPDNENIKIYQKRAERHLKSEEPTDKNDEEKINELYKHGVVKYMNGDLESAIKIWEQILTISPNDEKIINSLIKARKELDLDR